MAGGEFFYKKDLTLDYSFLTMATELQTRGEVLVEIEMIHWQTPPVS